MEFAYSVCIPTYNRADQLGLTLHGIVGQRGFNDDVEIIVMDNASRDHTKEMVSRFTDNYPTIRYERNDTNIGPDANILKSAAAARGKYIKLLNDNKVIREGIVDEWRILFREAEEGVVFHYPCSAGRSGAEAVQILEADEFSYLLSYHLTWLGGLSIKRESFHSLNLETIDTTSHLAQVEVLFEILKKETRAKVVFSDWFEEPNPPRRGGYNYFRVFNNNFPLILDRAQSVGSITRTTKRHIKRQLLVEHTFPFLLGSITDNTTNDLDKSHALYYVMKNFYSEFKLYSFPLWAARTFVKRFRKAETRARVRS